METYDQCSPSVLISALQASFYAKMSPTDISDTTTLITMGWRTALNTGDAKHADQTPPYHRPIADSVAERPALPWAALQEAQALASGGNGSWIKDVHEYIDRIPPELGFESGSPFTERFISTFRRFFVKTSKRVSRI